MHVHLLRYGLALEAALREVESEFVLVVQHDWLFVRDTDVRAAAIASRYSLCYT